MISCPSLNQSKITQHTLKITFSKANSHHIWLHGTFSSLPPDAECNFSAVIKLGQKEKMAFNILKHVKSEKKKPRDSAPGLSHNWQPSRETARETGARIATSCYPPFYPVERLR